MNRIKTASAIIALAFAISVLPGVPYSLTIQSALAFEGGGGGEGPSALPTAPAKPKVKKAPKKKKTQKTTAKREKATGNTKRTVAAKRKPRRPREISIDGLPADAQENRFVQDQVIVRFRLSSSQAAMDDIVRRQNLRHEAARTFRLAGATMHLYTIVGGAPVRQVIAALQADGTVVTAQPNYIYMLQQTTSSTLNPAQYALARLGIEEAHAITRGAGVPVAVIDSGIDFAHPELLANDHVSLSVTGEDNAAPHKHGTTIAGILAAGGTLTGIAPEAPVVGIRAFNTTDGDQPSSSSWMIAMALETAHENKAGVINMSFAGPRDPLIERSVAGAAKRGMIAVAAAGNGGPESAPLFPAAYEDVIAVTATDKDDGLFVGANRGDYVALSAPGVDILAPSPGGGYDVSTGTSMAAAHVSGLIALIMSRKPGLNRSEIMDILDTASTDLGVPGIDPEFGSGLPSALSAIKALGI